MWGFLRQPMWCFQNFSLCSKRSLYPDIFGYGGFGRQSAKDRQAKYGPVEDTSAGPCEWQGSFVIQHVSQVIPTHDRQRLSSAYYLDYSIGFQ